LQARRAATFDPLTGPQIRMVLANFEDEVHDLRSQFVSLLRTATAPKPRSLKSGLTI
jgi:hypothetical protein